jgi:hypothetical protein
LRDRLTAPTAGGAAWRCLRCGAFVTGEPHGRGPAAAAPLLRRGRELRDELILRVFAVERFIRFAVFAAAAYGVWRFSYDRLSVHARTRQITRGPPSPVVLRSRDATYGQGLTG